MKKVALLLTLGLAIGVFAGCGTETELYESETTPEVTNEATRPVTHATTKVETTPRPETVPEIEPPTDIPWYEGGTLHHATVRDWRNATHENKLATAGDWIAGLSLEGYLNTLRVWFVGTDELKPFAEELVAAMDGFLARAEDIFDFDDVATVAAVVMVEMGWSR